MAAKRNNYQYKNASMAIDATELMDKVHPEMVDLTGLSGHGVKKADIWMAALTMFLWSSSEEQLKALRGIGVDC